MTKGNTWKKLLNLGGFQSSLTDFFITAATEKADTIKKDNVWLSSENDREIFFNAVINPPAPNDKTNPSNETP